MCLLPYLEKCMLSMAMSQQLLLKNNIQLGQLARFPHEVAPHSTSCKQHFHALPMVYQTSDPAHVVQLQLWQPVVAFCFVLALLGVLSFVFSLFCGCAFFCPWHSQLW